jgi:eukaryotic-like serine/threonine-protein kinase
MSLGHQLTPVPKPVQPRAIGRYVMYEEIASGGMAAVHFGRLSSDAGFSRTVAIKYLHPHYARDAEFLSMFLDEARLVSRIRHPNVAAPLDVVVLARSEEVFLVMEYVHGETLARLIEEAVRLPLALPPNVSANIVSGALHGLHAAHEAVDELGHPLNIVHRDISPQNVMVGSDGVPRVLDFGIAKAASRSQSTREGQVKGKVSYMSPEQLTDRPVDRRTDIFAAGIVLWEALTMRRLFKADDLPSTIAKVLHSAIPRPSSLNGNVSQALDRVVLKALNRNPAARFQTARDFAAAIEEEAFVASTRKVSEWVSVAAARSLAERAEKVARIESEAVDAPPTEGTPPPVQSLRSISQTIAILQEAELRSPQQDDHGRPDNRILTGYAANPGAPRWESPTQVLATPVPQQETAPASAGNPTQALSQTAAGPVQGTRTAAVLVRPWSRKRRMVVGSVVLGLLLALASIGVAARSASRPLAAQPESGPTAPPPAVQTVSAGSAPTTRESSSTAPAGTPSEQAKRFAIATTASSPSGKPKHTRLAKPNRTAKGCDPPFFIDDKGIRRIKPECL